MLIDDIPVHGVATRPEPLERSVDMDAATEMILRQHAETMREIQVDLLRIIDGLRDRIARLEEAAEAGRQNAGAILGSQPCDCDDCEWVNDLQSCPCEGCASLNDD